jgi:ABC-type multidrug transport system ATPase subunit
LLCRNPAETATTEALAARYDTATRRQVARQQILVPDVTQPWVLVKEISMTTTASQLGSLVGGHGTQIVGAHLTVRHRNGAVALDDVSLAIEPGRLTAIVGPSGAGKTTLLSALAGITPVQEGIVTLTHSDDGGSRDIGFVPQDDILHGELPLRRTLRYAARLRMAAPAAAIDAAVDEAIDTLGLANRGDVAVRSLSGGQRKRANIACEILTRPEVCYLDEPTSGLDPAAAADLIDSLLRMCADGSTVVFTTHSIEDIQRSDQVVVLAPGGRLRAVGTPSQVLHDLAARSFTDLYEQLAGGGPRVGDHPVASTAQHAPSASRAGHRDGRPAALRQWSTLTHRALDILTRDRLTVAILLGSPAAVIAMFVVLFRPGAFNHGVDPTAAVQVAYWLSFAGFFFGLTFGLLQVCTEVPVLRRERHAGVRTAAYLASKVAVLTPILLLVNGLMIVVLRALDRIPHLSSGALLELNITMGLNAVAALCLGLLASAAVTSTAQAALALPMLCFPAVLFSGAMVPTSAMAPAGRAISAAMSDRWAFEAIARHLDIGTLAGPGSPYTGLGSSSFATYWALLGVFVAVMAAGAYAAVSHRAGPR